MERLAERLRRRKQNEDMMKVCGIWKGTLEEPVGSRDDFRSSNVRAEWSE